MNQEQIKSLIRHTLTALGTLFVLLGIDKFTHMIEYLQENLDGVFAAISTIVGVVVTLIGFFKDKSRWLKQEDQK